MYNMSFQEPYNSVINAQGQILFALATFQANGTNSLASTLSDSLKSASDTGCDLALQVIRGTDIFNQLLVKTIQSADSALDDIAEWMVTYSDQVPSDIITTENQIAQGFLLLTTTNINDLSPEQKQELLNAYFRGVTQLNALALKYTGSKFARIVSACQLLVSDIGEDLIDLLNMN
jgi:hypothetical protein